MQLFNIVIMLSLPTAALAAVLFLPGIWDSIGLLILGGLYLVRNEMRIEELQSQLENVEATILRNESPKV